MTTALKTNIGDWTDTAVERLFPGMEGRQILVLYVAIPIAIGAVLGWYRAGYTTNYPLAVSVFEWVTNFFLLWIAFDIGTRLVAFLLRLWSAPLWLLLILGGVAGVAVSRPLRTVIREMASDMAPGAQPDLTLPSDMVWEEYIFVYASVIAVPIFIWLVINYIFARNLGIPRYGHRLKDMTDGTQEEGDQPAGPPEFTKRLSLEPGAEISALQAEDHYLRVYSGKREDLIRYRFSDAVNELRGVPGLQVHRSFWINTEAIDSIKRAGRSYEIVLKSGLEVPVSRSYRYAVKEAGLLTRFPSRPSPLFAKEAPPDTGAGKIGSI